MSDMELLKELTLARGVSGYEGEVRHIMLRELKRISAKIVTDHIGSVFGEKEGTSPSPRILLAGHMDEVGFMVKEITKEGYLRFATLGGWWDQVLLSQRVSVVTEKRTFTGVIGSKPPHILTPEERKKRTPSGRCTWTSERKAMNRSRSGAFVSAIRSCRSVPLKSFRTGTRFWRRPWTTGSVATWRFRS